jgi:hypothetical protein
VRRRSSATTSALMNRNDRPRQCGERDQHYRVRGHAARRCGRWGI